MSPLKWREALYLERALFLQNRLSWVWVLAPSHLAEMIFLYLRFQNQLCYNQVFGLSPPSPFTRLCLTIFVFFSVILWDRASNGGVVLAVGPIAILLNDLHIAYLSGLWIPSGSPSVPLSSLSAPNGLPSHAARRRWCLGKSHIIKQRSAKHRSSFLRIRS